MEGAAGSVSDQKNGEEDKITGAPAYGSDEKKRPLVPSRRLSADAPAFIPRKLLPPQGREDSTPGAKAGGGMVSKPSRSPSPEVTSSTDIANVHSHPRTTSSATSGSTGERSPTRASPLREKGLSSSRGVPSSSPTSSGSTGEYPQIRAAAPPGKGYSYSPMSSASSGSTGEHPQIRTVAPPGEGYSSSPMSSASSGSTGERRHIPSSTPTSTGKGQTPKTDAASKDHLRRRRGSNSPDPGLLTPKNIGPRFQDPVPSSSRPQVPAYSAVLQHGRDTQQEMLKHKDAMLRYLKHVDCVHYKVQASRLGRRLTVDFCDLMWKESKLAEHICNSKGSNSYWLQDAAKSFFQDNGLPSDNVSFDFKDIPSRLHEAKEYMGTQPCVQERSICGRIANIDEATPHGRRGADVIVNGILGCVSRGISWSGKLTSEDLWFGEGPDGSIKLYIAKQPDHTANAPTKDRLLDIHKIWPALQGALNLVDGKLPLYFPELKRDLENARYLPPWFFTYLQFHPALYGSMPRRHVITSLQKSLKRFKASDQGKFNRVFSGKPLAGGDWRLRAQQGALNTLLKFRLIKPNKKGETNASTESSAEKRKETGGHGFSQRLAGNITGTSDVRKTTGETLGCDISSQIGEAPIKSQGYPDTLYVDTRESLLGYVRNGLQHLDQYLASEDEDEIELYLAMTFPEILLDVIRGLLQTCNMGGCFASAWDTYKKSK